MPGAQRRPTLSARAPVAPRATMPPRSSVPISPPEPGGLQKANRIALYSVLAFFGFLVLYITHEVGRYNGSYDRLAVSQQLTERDVQIEHLESSNRQLRTQLAELDTIKVGRQREQAEVSRTIGDLQAQVARMSQELAFYRGVMAKAPTELGVRLGEVHISHGRRPGLYVVHIPLLRTGRPDNNVQGTITVHVDSDRGKVIDLAELTGGRQKEIPYDFRFYKNIDQEVALPDDFKPHHLSLDVHSNQKDAPPLAQTYLWNVLP